MTSLVFLILLLYVSISPFNSIASTSTSSSSSFSASSKELKGHNEEALALQNWKYSLNKHSQSLLSTWEIMDPTPSNHCNSWFGISCNKAGRVDNITVESAGLKGKLSDLNFSSLPHLTTIHLFNNSLSGKIPSQLCQLANIRFLDLERNQISGTIPEEVGLLRSLSKLSFGFNKLTGSIPASIGNLTNINVLYLHGNQLVGAVPSEIGLLSSLTDLEISHNNMSGSIPSSIGNLSKLSILFLHNNQLVGAIPSEIALLSSITVFDLGINTLTGIIPASIWNLSNLIILNLHNNHLVGTIAREFPISLNNITRLTSLQISGNHFTGQLPDNICSGGYLTRLGAENNNLIGHVPKSIYNCSSLERVRLDMNHLTGNVSEDFGVYPHLDYIDLSYNNFYGEVSQNWAQCHNLSSLRISNNNLSETIPQNIGWAQKLQKLDLSSNHLTGEVPKQMGNLLSDINLSNNRLQGSIALEIGNLPNLESLNLAANNLSGLFPKELAQCTRLIVLNLSKNGFDGNIPLEIGNFEVLETLDLAKNSFSGEIPPQVGQLLILEILNLSHNQFSGSIPNTFSSMVSLISIDLSYNQLESPIPNIKAFELASFDAFKDNKNLCGNITGLKNCPVEIRDGTRKKKNKGTLLWIIAPTLSFSLFMFVLVGFLIHIKDQRKKISDTNQENNENVFSIWSYDGKLVYRSTIDETEYFNAKYCIGMGGSGEVFKVALPGGEVFAVKKLHALEHGELNNQKAFTSEVRALAEIRHRNIVKLYGFCLHPRHSFLVYEFLEGGALEKILSNEMVASCFEWNKRIDTIKDIAHGLFYMHHECSPPIVHRDISSKNVLLDSEWVAHISDFGTARILKTNSTNCTSFAGTFGYAAPELAYTMEVNEKQDVFSFGILTLEVLMGRHPGDLVSSLFTSLPPSSRTIPGDFSHTLLKDVLDPRLPTPRNNRNYEEIVCSVKLAFACLQVVPNCRPTMKQVSTELSKQKLLVGSSFFKITLGQLLDSNY